MKTLPTIEELYQLCRSVKIDISDEYRAYPEEDVSGIQLTIGWNPDNGGWSYQTGDNSFTGSAYHYPIWAVRGIYRDTNCRDIARALQNELDEQTY